jgi:hypothetical protein
MTLARPEAQSLPVTKIEDDASIFNLVEPVHEDFRQKPPTQPRSPEPFEYVVNGDVALISLTNTAGDHAIWRVPADQLEWAKEIAPVYLKRLPLLEPQEAEELRKFKAKQKRTHLFKSTEEREALAQEAARLEAAAARAKARDHIPRYCVMKSRGDDIPVHRLFTNAKCNEKVVAMDTDFLNYHLAPVRTITTYPAFENGFAWRPPLSEVTSTEFVPNLQALSAKTAKDQDAFEEEMLQTKTNEYNEIDESPLKIQPNWDLGKRTGVGGGRIGDCGESRPSAPIGIDQDGTQASDTSGGDAAVLDKLIRAEERDKQKDRMW